MNADNIVEGCIVDCANNERMDGKSTGMPVKIQTGP
jgi:hypothetical protein